MIEEQGGCVSCLSWAHTTLKSSLKEPKNPGPGAASLRCQEREGTGVCDRAHHKMLHGSKFAYMSANLVLGAPRGPVASRSDLFGKAPRQPSSRRQRCSNLRDSGSPCDVGGEGRKVPGIVFTDSGSNTNILIHNLAQQLQLEGANTKIFLKLWTKTKRKRRSKFIG